MSYIALARKWRPRTFSQLVGQEHINKALVNSLNQERLHHAYLFTGTRGVGKTSIARLLSKALNCERGVSAEPCLQCTACLAIEQGQFIDLIEIDGASRTRVEDTRDMLDNVQYLPTNGRYKIYLIDEVHMLSQHSFNALLKTLEEPPRHVKFLLATTDPQKLPVTILSRCLQFALKHLTPEVIAQQLQTIIDAEQVVADASALALLAQAARGSMRDALSLLDQAIAVCGERLSLHEIKSILGYTQQDYALQLLQALTQSSAESIFSLTRQIAAEGGHFIYALDEILNYLHHIALAQCIPNAHALISPSSEIKGLSTQLSAEDVQLFYQIGIKGKDDMHLAPTLAIGFEMTLLRMLAFRPSTERPRQPTLHYEVHSTSNTHHANESLSLPSVPEALAFPAPISPISPISPIVPIAPAGPALAPLENPPVEKTPPNIPWNEIVPRLKLSGLALNAVENAELINLSDTELTLRVDKGHLSLFTPSIAGRIEQALASLYNLSIRLKLCTDTPVSASPAQQKKALHTEQLCNAELALHNDPFFQRLQQTFSGEVVKNSITSIKNSL